MENEKTVPKRLQSLDALRGFDMFWITGGQAIFIGFATLTQLPLFQWWGEQLHHMPWHGFRFEDLIFPLFLFIAGISFPFSYSKRIANKESRYSIYKHVIMRGFILVFLGILFNNGIRFSLDSMRYGSVLGRIGLAWMFAAIIFMNTKLSFRIIWLFGLLTGYWLLLSFFPYDPASADIYSKDANLASYIDRLIMPGKLYLGNHDPEGLFSTIPAIGTALLGMFTGEFMLSEYMDKKPLRKVLMLVTASVILIIIGKVWNIFFPINKNLWTSSFVCFAGGISLFLFAVFYLIIDVWKQKKWAFFFMIIGMNPITIYLTARVVNFDSANKFLFGGFMDLFPESWAQLISGIGITAIGWFFLYFLYRQRIFLKV